MSAQGTCTDTSSDFRFRWWKKKEEQGNGLEATGIGLVGDDLQQLMDLAAGGFSLGQTPIALVGVRKDRRRALHQAVLWRK
jgi:hypothetical protein